MTFLVKLEMLGLTILYSTKGKTTARGKELAAPDCPIRSIQIDAVRSSRQNKLIIILK